MGHVQSIILPGKMLTMNHLLGGGETLHKQEFDDKLHCTSDGSKVPRRQVHIQFV